MKLKTMILFLLSFNIYGNTKSDMQQILNEVLVLQNLSNSQSKIAPKLVTNSLQKLKHALDNSKHNLLEKSPTFRSNITFLKQNIQNIYNSVKLKHNTYTKLEIKRLVSTCINCHAQLPASVFKEIKNKKTTNFLKTIKSRSDKGIIKYMLRDYMGAIKTFQNELYSIKKPYKQEKTILLILKIYIVNLDEKASALNFLNTLPLEKLVFKDIKRIVTWKESLKAWIKRDKADLSIDSLTKDYLASYENELQLGNSMEKEIDLIALQHRLQKELTIEKSTKSAAQSLYWLGLIENATPELYSLGDLYLKDCILKYPKSAYAKKAYTAYKKSIILGYSGSMGTHIPNDIKLELEQMNKRLEEK